MPSFIVTTRLKNFGTTSKIIDAPDREAAEKLRRAEVEPKWVVEHLSARTPEEQAEYNRQGVSFHDDELKE